jgi:uracil-DNA glycosylase family 4
MTWNGLNRKIVTCQRCPRLREHCLATARVKRASFANEDYWGKPAPNWAAPDPASVKLLIVGLAPAAHGANRTGRLFTGDRSGDFLFRAMYETGFASQPTSIRKGDGLELIDCAITGVCHCAPPDNKPTLAEMANCRDYLDQTAHLLPGVRGILALGGIAFNASLRLLQRTGWEMPRPMPKFGHGAIAWSLPRGPDNLNTPTASESDPTRRFVIGSYHPSQQNTFTGRLTPAMLRDVFLRAKELINAEAGYR